MIGETFRYQYREFKTEALNHVRQVMRRVRKNIETIIANLSQDEYQFAFPENVLVPPDPNLFEWIGEYENKGIYIPLSLQAWLSEIGCVNLMGSHPKWEKPAYIFEDGPRTNDVWYTDPLVVFLTNDYVDYLYEEWKYHVEEKGLNEYGPFRLDIAPDHIHKANISGGLPFQVLADTPAVDAFLINERHCTSFLNYVRIAIARAGFPGFDYINDAQTGIVSKIQKQLK